MNNDCGPLGTRQARYTCVTPARSRAHDGSEEGQGLEVINLTTCTVLTGGGNSFIPANFYKQQTK